MAWKIEFDPGARLELEKLDKTALPESSTSYTGG
jgi:hypothetical protein